MTGADAAAVLVIVPIEDVVATVFDGPVPPVDLQYLPGIGLFRGLAGDAVGYLMGVFAGLLVDRFPFDDEGLPDVGKVEVAVECGGGADFPGFDPPMVGWRDLDEIRLPPALEEQGNVLLEGRLVAFGGEMVMRLPLPGHVVSQFALREQGVGADDLAFDVDGIKQGDGGFDLVGLLDGVGIAADRQGAYFFWVWQALVWWPTTPMT